MNNLQKIKLIIITAYYPPIISVASQRLHAIAKYVDKNIFNVYVIFPYSGQIDEKSSKGITLVPVKNKSIVSYAKFNKNTPYILHKLKALWNRILINLGISQYKGFENKVYSEIKKIIGNETFAIISSSPPIEVHKIAYNIKSKYPNCIWISDLRDAITGNPYILKNQRKNCFLIEQKILEYSDAITTVSTLIVNQLEIKNKRKMLIVEVRNGFDFESRIRIHFNEEFTMLYAGTFYAERTPYTFFKAVENLKNKGILENFRIILVGQTSGIKIPSILNSNVQKIDKVKYEESIKLMQLADTLLLIHPPSEYKGVYTGKLFDYLGSMRPIVALVDKTDVAAQLIEECNAGFIADFYDIEEIEKAIAEAYNLWKNKKTLPYNVHLIYFHHRAYQVKIFEHLIFDLRNGK